MILGSNSQMISLLYIVGLFAILYFLMIRPQQQRQKKQQDMMKNLKPDDHIVTIGGIYGTIVKMKENTLVLNIADNVRIEVLQSAVSRVISKDEK
ncbi:MAG: preprotein translocase subunit YajC [Desulfotomaculaceae bacterium]|nr:preprotein translocase subunit YajC [Desulfotomaculaceae bacterium]